MTRTIRIEISKNGRIEMDFLGFPGETCLDEEENLTRILRSLGLWAVPITIERKDVERIKRELGAEEERRKEVKAE
ncbi:MAG: DUF2997 domain-containing protein [Firmicutes bacterium]|nr:DUF2997 domain-containing protein [Candidatus Fermentithermobacillaceae bacterium]